MIVLSITNCPPRLRGDLSKWLNEINTGVYIGKLSARVREKLWERICDNIQDGQATMIYSAANAQGYGILVYNTSWEPVDFDGLTLMRRPLKVEKRENSPVPGREDVLAADGKKKGKPDTVRSQVSSNDQALAANNDTKSPVSGGQKRKQTKKADNEYVILDLETTGLESEHDRIIEIAAIRIKDGQIQEQYQCLVKQNIPVPEFVVNMTGITDDMLYTQGVEENVAIEGLVSFIGAAKVVGYNIKFDVGFIRETCERHEIEIGITKTSDVLWAARRKIHGIENYRLETVAGYFFEGAKVCHRALDDCILIHRIYSKLNEI